MFQSFAYKTATEASAFKDNRDHVKRSSISSPKDIFQWIPVATKEARKIFDSNIMGLPLRKAIPSTLITSDLLNSAHFLRAVLTMDTFNKGKQFRAEDIKKNSFQNTDQWRSHLEPGDKLSLPSYLPNLDLNDIGRSRWKKTLLIPSLSLADVNRKKVLRISGAQSSAVSNEVIGSLNIQARDVSGAGKELVFHVLPDIEYLIEQKLTEIKSSMILTKETMMAQSATIYSKIETDLKRQFNIDQISEQVYRQIDHRLKIECERRGIL
jgi:hypothetical protein